MGKFFDMIHEKANATWTGGQVTKDNFDEWADHWFACGEAIHDGFVKEGLNDTAAYMRNLIDDAKNFHYRDKK